jgi:putative transposase
MRRKTSNKALALQEQNHKDGGKFIRYEEMAKHLMEWKKDPQTIWLKDAPSQPLPQALMNLDKAYKRFFDKRADHPTFKKRGQRDSFRLCRAASSIDSISCRHLLK